MLALGLIETKGLIGAIEAADAMLKAADVRLLEKSLATGGLVTITIAGEVSAVQSAVDAAQASLARIDGVQCVSRHVIPRPDAELNGILLLRPREAAEEQSATALAPIAADAPESPATPEAKEIAKENPAASNPAQPGKNAEGFDPDKCKTMSMNKLRQLAASMQVSLTREQIASSNRQTLIDAIDRAARKEKE